MADGSITFDTKVDNTGITQGLKNIRTQLKTTQAEYNKIEKQYMSVQKKLE